MTQCLLAIETGPISWALSIGEPTKPPESFVWYLADVLTAGVQLYLTNNTGKEYWIKHVRFWSDLLDPESDWWDTDRGYLYKDYAKRLYTNLHKHWESSDYIECQCGNDQKIFVRACILFARNKTKATGAK